MPVPCSFPPPSCSFPCHFTPALLPGHSLGGLIAALACLRDQTAWSGLLLCSAALDVEMGLVLRCVWVGRLCLLRGVPSLRVGMGWTWRPGWW